MIKKVIRRDVLSGVSSPLLPLIYADFDFATTETDGVYVQTDSGDEIIAVFSLKNGCATLVKVKGLVDADELNEFFLFLSVESCLSDCDAFQKNSTILPLLKCVVGEKNCADYLKLDEYSRVGEYKAVYDLLNKNGDNFPEWYAVMSKKINSRRAAAVYKRENNDYISTAIATAVYGENAVISGVYTLECQRGKGFATQCVSGLLAELGANDVKCAYLWCEEDKIPFYEKIGFVKIGDVIREDF